MHQTILGPEEVHESAKIDDFHDLALIDGPDFWLRRDGFDPITRGVDFRLFAGRNLDRAIVRNINLSAGLFDDFANDLTTGADDFADLIRCDLERFDLGGEFAKLFTRAGNRLVHLTQDMDATIIGLT